MATFRIYKTVLSYQDIEAEDQAAAEAAINTVDENALETSDVSYEACAVDEEE